MRTASTRHARRTPRPDAPVAQERRSDQRPQVATLVGYSPRQIQRWWQAYRTAGLAGLTRVYHPAGKPARLTEDAWAGLQVELEAGRIGGQEEARRYLEETWGVRYKTIHGISYQFKKRKVKWKTGRRRHAKADPAAQAAFRQTSPPR
jgi:transposase